MNNPAPIWFIFLSLAVVIFTACWVDYHLEIRIKSLEKSLVGIVEIKPEEK